MTLSSTSRADLARLGLEVFGLPSYSEAEARVRCPRCARLFSVALGARWLSEDDVERETLSTGTDVAKLDLGRLRVWRRVRLHGLVCDARPGGATDDAERALWERLQGAYAFAEQVALARAKAAPGSEDALERLLANELGLILGPEQAERIGRRLVEVAAKGREKEAPKGRGRKS